jgi:hypothetical protein
MREAGFEPDSCAPTQQSTSQAGDDIPDLSGAGWALEAYGGHDYGNNKKLIEDLCSLDRWQFSTLRWTLNCLLWLSIGTRCLSRLVPKSSVSLSRLVRILSF